MTLDISYQQILTQGVFIHTPFSVLKARWIHTEQNWPNQLFVVQPLSMLVILIHKPLTPDYV